MKSRPGISASRVRFHSADQHRARANGSVMSPRWDLSVASDVSSKRILQYVRSSSLTRTRSGAALPASSPTTVRGPNTSTSARAYRVSAPASLRYRPTATRCGRSSGWDSAASWRTDSSVIRPSALRITCGVRELTPAVSSQARDQVARSRPEVSSSTDSRSPRRVLPYALRLK